MKNEFGFCSICEKKIGFFRKRKDNSSTKMIPSNQFCSNKCNKKGLDILLKQIEGEVTGE